MGIGDQESEGNGEAMEMWRNFNRVTISSKMTWCMEIGAGVWGAKKLGKQEQTGFPMTRTYVTSTILLGSQKYLAES